VTGIITFDQARAIAERFFDHEVRPEVAGEVLIVDHGILETLKEWIFPYNERRFLETRDPVHTMVGNGPVIVPKDGGDAWVLHAGLPFEDHMPGYDKAKVYE
jgi:hypothetical protein